MPSLLCLEPPYLANGGSFISVYSSRAIRFVNKYLVIDSFMSIPVNGATDLQALRPVMLQED